MQSIATALNAPHLNGRDSRGRFVRGHRALLSEDCRRPTLGRTWHITESRWDRCRECGAFCEMWGRQKYCTPRCRRRVNMRAYRARRGGIPLERRRYRLTTIPDGLHVVKRPYAEGFDEPPWWEQPDPGRAVLVPLTPELEDAIARAAHPLSGYPTAEPYRPSIPKGQVAIERTRWVANESEWDRLLHDLLLGALRRVCSSGRVRYNKAAVN